MASIKFYSLIYVILLALAVSKVLFMDYLDYWEAVAAISVTAWAKAILIAAYYQHLREEPRAITWIVLLSLGGVLLLAAAATFSIT